MQIDKLIFDFLNGLAKKSAVADMLWVFLAQYAIFLFGIALIYFIRKDRKLFLRLLPATLITIVTVMVIKKVWPHPRPSLNEEVNLLIENRLDSAFPSKHAAVAFVVAFGIFLQKKKPGAWFLLLALGIALSRVIVGVHYPSDVLAGALIGMGIAGMTHKLFLKYEDTH